MIESLYNIKSRVKCNSKLSESLECLLGVFLGDIVAPLIVNNLDEFHRLNSTNVVIMKLFLQFKSRGHRAFFFK